jgi:hypothetical protein
MKNSLHEVKENSPRTDFEFSNYDFSQIDINKADVELRGSRSKAQEAVSRIINLTSFDLPENQIKENSPLLINQFNQKKVNLIKNNPENNMKDNKYDFEKKMEKEL